MKFPVLLLIICCFCSDYNFFQLHTFCFAQYDRIGNTYEQIRDADFYKKPGHKYYERIGAYSEEQNSRKGPFSTQSTKSNNSENKLTNNNNKDNHQNLSNLNKKD
ncbi:hypothetical protein ACH3XW_2115 [Acanthocheilonema viteae]